MAKVNSELRLADLVLLRIIAKHPNLHKHELWQPRGGLLNMELKPLVEVGRCGYVTSDHRYASSIATLRFAGLVKDDCYEATSNADELFAKLHKSMKSWPLVIWLNPDGTMDLEHAQYFEQK